MKNKSVFIVVGLIVLTLVFVSIPFVMKGNRNVDISTEESGKLPDNVADMFETQEVPTEEVTEKLTEVTRETTTLSEWESLEAEGNNTIIDLYWDTYKYAIDCEEEEFKGQCLEYIKTGQNPYIACEEIVAKYMEEQEDIELTREDIIFNLYDTQEFDINISGEEIVPYDKAEKDDTIEIKCEDMEEVIMYASYKSNIRIHPSVSSDKIGELEIGDEIVIIGEVMSYDNKDVYWYKIKFDEDKIGYINGFQVTIFKEVEVID